MKKLSDKVSQVKILLNGMNFAERLELLGEVIPKDDSHESLLLLSSAINNCADGLFRISLKEKCVRDNDALLFWWKLQDRLEAVADEVSAITMKQTKELTAKLHN